MRRKRKGGNKKGCQKVVLVDFSSKVQKCTRRQMEALQKLKEVPFDEVTNLVPCG